LGLTPSTLAETFGAAIGKVIERMSQSLNEFIKATNDKDRALHGRKITAEMLNFGGNLKHALDGKVYG
jgi:hypothetical protein